MLKPEAGEKLRRLHEVTATFRFQTRGILETEAWPFVDEKKPRCAEPVIAGEVSALFKKGLSQIAS
ncbi:MAG TPA: hypothetical protein VHY09_11025 [Candidatus Methylacidiphilales bacterium]|jgi:hypothetical protein|nr:hypothetical protein [Candidatus Methylacidiphilales bacterium]